jgi:cysteine desulfurase/selenocysteine lyase
MSAHAELLESPDGLLDVKRFDVDRIREDFPILREKIHGKPLIYLDNAATSQKPKAVIDALVDYYSHYNANVHRAVHLLSTRATRSLRTTRERKFAALSTRLRTKEIIFIRGTTEGLNLVAQTHGRQNIGPGDEVLISGLEHHSNIVPWQMLCDEKQARLRVVHIDDRGSFRSINSRKR